MLVKLFLSGDVMTGRGVDQILPQPCDPIIHEPAVASAREYVALAEAANGPIPRPVDFAYVWGDALAEIEARSPDARIVNLETSVTTSEEAAPKGINYRMNPANVRCLQAARVDCCALANNHVLDWGAAGLMETLESLHRAGIAVAGAGRTADEAERPAVVETPAGGRVLVFAYGSPTSGVPAEWRASPGAPGVNYLPDFSAETARAVCEHMSRRRQPGDLCIASIHWGGNWGYEVPEEQRRFAHRLIDEGGVDIVHGHSSHHVKGIEVHRERLVLYGCGDFINDYEGIGGYEEFQPHLALAYFVSFDNDPPRLTEVHMVSFRRRRMRLERAAPAEAEWLGTVLNREGMPFGTSVASLGGSVLELRWR